MQLSETFDSIQGEGIHAGLPMTFIRLQGCNLACVWCDTKHALKEDVSCEIQLGDIIVTQRWACITGGEPLFQPDALAYLVLHLSSSGKKIEIETNGSIKPPPWAFADLKQPLDAPYPLVASWVVDVKLGSSGNPADGTIYEWTKGMRASYDQFKLVLGNQEDMLEARTWIPELKRRNHHVPILVSPVFINAEHPGWQAKVAAFAIEMNVRFSLQIHKVLWGNKRGV